MTTKMKVQKYEIISLFMNCDKEKQIEEELNKLEYILRYKRR